MAEVGILRPDDRVELLRGEIYEMAPIGSRHAGCVNILTQQLITGLTGRAIVSVQNPAILPDESEPEPDIAVLVPRPDFYTESHPGPADVLLIIEVADTSLRHDRVRKLPIYAAAGIPEVWIVDLNANRVLVYRQPRDGAYRQTMVVDRTGSLSPLAFPDFSLVVADLLL